MSLLYNEPVGNTCPDIDYVIDSINAAITYINSPSDPEGYTYEDRCEDVKGALWDLEKKMEELRSANSALRDWGNQLVAHSQSLEDQVELLESKIF